MDEDRRLALAARALEAVQRNEPDLLDDIVAEDVVDHASPRPDAGREGVKAAVPAFARAFHDVRIEIDAAIAGGDHVAHRVTVRGTHSDTFAGVPATGRAATWSVMHWWRFQDGRIVEHWSLADVLGLLRQLGRDPLGRG